MKAKKRKERNKILKEIKELIKKGGAGGGGGIIEKELEEFEPKHTDVSKCFEAVRLLKRKKSKRRLIVYNRNGDMVNIEKQQTNEITNFFR